MADHDAGTRFVSASDDRIALGQRASHRLFDQQMSHPGIHRGQGDLSMRRAIRGDRNQVDVATGKKFVARFQPGHLGGQWGLGQRLGPPIDHGRQFDARHLGQDCGDPQAMRAGADHRGIQNLLLQISLHSVLLQDGHSFKLSWRRSTGHQTASSSFRARARRARKHRLPRFFECAMIRARFSAPADAWAVRSIGRGIQRRECWP